MGPAVAGPERRKFIRKASELPPQLQLFRAFAQISQSSLL